VPALLALGAATASAQVKLEAEAFTNRGGGSGASRTGGSNGLGVTNASDTGLDGEPVSGSQIGFYNNNEYLEYKVTIPQDGMYQITARGGFVAETLTLRFWDLTYGVVLDEQTAVTDANSGGYDANKFNKFPLPVSFPMKAGDHTLRIYEVGQYGWNADYYTFTRTGPLSGFGLVSGTVTGGGVVPLNRAQVYADVSDVYLNGEAPLGFRAIADATGKYSLLLPVGNRALFGAAQGYDDPLTSQVSLAVTESTNLDRLNITAAANLTFEAEWWDDAIQTPDGTTQGPGLTTFVEPVASQGEYVGGFDPGNWARYKVSVPAAGAYRVMLQYATLDTIHAGWSVAETGSAFDETAPGTGGFDVLGQYTTAGVLRLQAGVNTVRLSNNAAQNGQFNPDYFQLIAVPANEVATLTGVVTDGATSQPVADVLVSVTDANLNVLRTRTDAQGKYTLTLGAGDVGITADKTGYTTASASATLTGGQTTTKDLQISAARVGGKVVDQAGTPYAGVTVTVYAEDGATILNEAVTDAAGNYSVNLAGGIPAVVVVAAPMSLPGRQAVTIGAPGTTTPANFTLTRLAGGTPVPFAYDDDFFSPNTSVTNHSPLSADGSLPAEEGPVGARTIQGVNFVFPAAAAYANGALNVRTLLTGPLYAGYDFLGSSFDVPNLKGTAAVFIGLSEGAQFPGGDALITYSDLSTDSAPFYLPDWYAGPTGAPLAANRKGDNTLLPPTVFGVYTFSHRHLDGIPSGQGDGPPHLFRYYSVVLPLNPAKTVTNITLPADSDTTAPNPLIAAFTIANAASTTPPLASARKAVRVAGGLDAAPAAGAAFDALNPVNTGSSQNRIDIADAVALAKAGL
jgi:hypothetical protein